MAFVYTPIILGSAPNDGQGDPDRTAWTKANTMFQQLGQDVVAAAAGSSGGSGGTSLSFVTQTLTATGSVTLSSGSNVIDEAIFNPPSGGSMTATIPAPPSGGKMLLLKRASGSAGSVTVTITLDGTSQSLTWNGPNGGEGAIVIADSTAGTWREFASQDAGLGIGDLALGSALTGTEKFLGYSTDNYAFTAAQIATFANRIVFGTPITSAGLIPTSETYSIINNGSSAAYTLGPDTIDGKLHAITNYGAGTATVTVSKLVATSNAVVSLPQGAVLDLVWNNTLSTYLYAS